MQWFLQRLVAMSGAAGWPQYDFDDDDKFISVLADEFNSHGLGHENIYDWIPAPQENGQEWANGGNFENTC
jgi:hypothetical protein